MNKKDNKKVYILYSYNKYKKDLEYIKEYYQKKDILKDDIVKLKNKYSINQYIYNKIDEIKSLINDRYVIIADEIKD